MSASTWVRGSRSRWAEARVGREAPGRPSEPLRGWRPAVSVGRTRRHLLRLAVALAAILAALGVLAAAPGLAAQRFAAPNGLSTNNPCSQANPCDIVTAINGTAGNMPADGDEVILASGSYGSARRP